MSGIPTDFDTKKSPAESSKCHSLQLFPNLLKLLFIACFPESTLISCDEEYGLSFKMAHWSEIIKKIHSNAHICNMLLRNDLISFIRINDPSYTDVPLEKESLETLVIIKTQVELSLFRKNQLQQETEKKKKEI